MKNRILLVFQGKNTKFFDTKTYFQSQISAYFRCFILTSRWFSQQWNSIPSRFHTQNCNSARFSCFSREKLPNFLIQKRIFRVKFLHISDLFSSYKQMVSSAIEARFCRIFMRIIVILRSFSIFFFKQFKDKSSK